MDRTPGVPEVAVALIDGPVAPDHAGLAGATIRRIGPAGASCGDAMREACQHGTYVAGLLVAARDSGAAAICPGCTLLVRPIFSDRSAAGARTPIATSDALGDAIVDGVKAGARLLNVSAALAGPSRTTDRRLLEALDYAAQCRAMVVVAAGNQGIGSSVMTRHPWVIPVVACNTAGRPAADANVSHLIGRNGLMAPGVDIQSLDAGGDLKTSTGTSAAAPFVTGTLALLWSLFPHATAADLRTAVTQAGRGRRSIVPPVLDASTAFAQLARRHAPRH
jgi:subtilisin family serine protease